MIRERGLAHLAFKYVARLEACTMQVVLYFLEQLHGWDSLAVLCTDSVDNQYSQVVLG